MTNHQRNKKLAVVQQQLRLAVAELRVVAKEIERTHAAANQGSMRTRDRNAVLSLLCADRLADYASNIEALNHQLQDLHTPYEARKRKAS